MCIFCKIIDKEIPAKIVKEDSEFIAFRDINPQASTHLLIIPKVHTKDFQTTSLDVLSSLGGFIQGLASEFGLEDNYKLQVNNGSKAGQEVPHLHFHLLSNQSI